MKTFIYTVVKKKIKAGYVFAALQVTYFIKNDPRPEFETLLKQLC